MMVCLLQDEMTRLAHYDMQIMSPNVCFGEERTCRYGFTNLKKVNS